MRKIIFVILIFAISLNAQKLDKLVLSGPGVAISYPLLKMLDDGVLEKVAKKVEFIRWHNPDQIRTMMVNKSVDFVALPSNVGAIFYNKGIKLKLLNISVWGKLWILSYDKNAKTLEDIAHKKIAIPYKGDMLEIVFDALIKNKSKLKQSISKSYANTPLDAMGLLLAKKVDFAILPEPVVSIIKAKDKNIQKSINIQEFWGKTFQVKPKMALVGINAMPHIVKHKDVVKLFNKEYKKALNWCKNNPQKVGNLLRKYIKAPKDKIIVNALNSIVLDYKSAKNSKKQVELFFNILKKSNPKKIGGKLPDDGFYY